MIKHIVAFQLKNPANAPAMKAILTGLKDEPLVRHWEAGINSGSSGKPYEVAIYSEFDSMADLLVFREGPKYNQVKQAIAGFIETRGTIDYVTDD